MGALAGVVLAGSLAGCIVKPTPVAPGGRVVQYSARRIELAGGLRVVLERAPDFGVAGAVLMVGAGSGDEHPSKAGLAHLTEHVVAEAKHDGWSLIDRVRRLGVRANAMTSWDETTYYALDDAGALEDLITALDGVLTEPTAGVDEALLERERRAVLNELRLRTENGTPGQAAGWLMAATFAAGHPYGRPVAGTAESLSTITLDDVRAFAAAHYRPDRSTLVVSAPLPLEETQALVQRIMTRTGRAAAGPWPSRGRTDAGGVRATRASFEIRAADVPVPMLWVGWWVPPSTGATAATVPLLEGILQASYWREVSQRDGDIAGVEPSLVRGSAASLLAVAVTLKQATHPERSARVVADALSARVQDFEAIKRYVAAKHVYADEDLLSRALRLAWSAHHVGEPTFLRTLDERIVLQSWDDVRGYADAFLGPERAHVVLVRPGAAPPLRTVSAPAAAPAPPLLPAVSTGSAAPPLPLPAARTRTRDAVSEKRPPLFDNVQTRTLSNGLTVIMLPRAGSPFHTAMLGFRGGAAQATPPGVLVAARWGRRWTTMSPDVLGLQYRYQLTADSTLEVLQSTGSDVALTLKLLGEHVGHETFWPPQQFLDLLEVFEREERTPASLFERAFSHAFFGDHPLGRRPTVAEIQRISATDVLRWVHRVRRPRNAALVIVGDFDPAEAVRSAQVQLGNWGDDAGATPEVSMPSPVESRPRTQDDDGRLVVQDRPGSLKATLRLRCWLPRFAPDKLAARAIFEESIERTLMSELREQLGASYDVSTRTYLLRGGVAYYELEADADYERLAAALRSARELFRRPSAAFEDPVRFEQLEIPGHPAPPPRHARSRGHAVRALEPGLAAGRGRSDSGASSPGPRRRGSRHGRSLRGDLDPRRARRCGQGARCLARVREVKMRRGALCVHAHIRGAPRSRITWRA